MFDDIHIAAFGISPYRKAAIPLGEYNAGHYLTLLYHAFINLNWHIGYFDHDGIIAYTNISWSSYSEEISARVYAAEIVIKSECVGYQGLFNDYGKNQDNLDRLFTEVEYAEFHLKDTLEQSAQELMDTIPEKQFLSLDNPPMAGKEKLRSFLSAFTPQPKYFITPILVLANIAIFIITVIAISFLLAIMFRAGKHHQGANNFEEIYLFLGFNSRSQVLNGQVWRLLTNIFLHFSVMHLLGNMIVLIYIGAMIESKLGRWNFLMLYLCSGGMASMVSVIWHDKLTAGGGASGAIFGLFGILLALLSTDFYERSARRALLISTLIFVVYCIIPGSRQVDYAAHIGGLVSGYVLGMMAYFGLINPNPALKKWGISLIGTLITVLFIACSLLFTPDYNFQEYESLNLRSTILLSHIDGDFYYGDNMAWTERMEILDQKGRADLAQLNTLSNKFSHLKLPARKKQIATIKGKRLKLQYIFFSLLYKEFKEKDKIKYRDSITDYTERINNLSRQLEDLENEDD